MISVGIFNGYFPYTLEESIEKINNLGFSTIQLDLAFKGMDFSTPESITSEKCKTIRDSFRDANLPICCISGYTNIIHPDKTERKRRLDYLKAIIRNARNLGSPYVVSETGTYNTESDWVHDPKNKTEEGWEEARKVTEALANDAYNHDAVFLVENYVNNVIGSVDDILRMFSEISSPALGLMLDPTNYFTDYNINDIDGELNRIFNALNDKVVISHAKDCKAAVDQEEKHADLDASEAHSFRGAGAVELPAPGLGSLNYDLYLKRLAKNHPNIPLIIEHLDESDIPRAKAFIDEKLKKLGV